MSEGEQFAALLRALKDRSGKSYGVLAGKLHVSTSTLHRYCNGDAVPTDYAPVERLARLCAATPDELVELHRRWILADGARRRARAEGAAPTPVAEAVPTPVAEAAAEPSAVPEPSPVPEATATAKLEPAAMPEPAAAAASGASGETAPADDATPSRTPCRTPGRTPGGASSLAPSDAPARASRRRLRIALTAAAVVAALAIPAAVIANSAPGESDDKAADRSAVGASATPSTDAKPSSAKPSASPSKSASASASPSKSRSAPPSSGRKAAPPTGDEVPLRVGLSSYNWDEPCGQFFLVDREPKKVPPPAAPHNHRGWKGSEDGVDAGHMRVQLTATGKTADAVVINKVRVQVVGRKPALPWNAYSMGEGCGSGVTPQWFDVDMDPVQPKVKPVAGQDGDTVVPAKDFPFQVSSKDPQVINFDVHTEQHDVNWYLEVDWSLGDQKGTVRVDDEGKPFRTSAIEGRTVYEWWHTTNEWLPEGSSQPES
ncbi:helix-turn-helix domain-containing protein [Streptomyces sp. NPDC051907]|uniref:helix-turn-helix domain-containing protein n=1 Tax=Streptomyces sp. NPDC051907 TaxID=3155284 RepID=UPI003433E171